MNMLQAATFTVSSVADSSQRLTRWLEYERVEEGRIEAALAASWDAPGMTGQPYALMRPASRANTYLRLIQSEPVAAYRPLQTWGWAAMELCVRDTLEVHARLASSPYRVIGPPRELDGLPAIFPMQVQGPDAEVIFLTQIRAELPEYDLPRATSLVDRLFIIVLACSDMAASMSWFERTLGITPGRAMQVKYTVLSEAFGMPSDELQSIATGTSGRQCFLEFDQYPKSAQPRPVNAGALPPGIALASFVHRHFDALEGAWIRAPVRPSGLLYRGGRAGTLRAPDGTLVEIVESRDE